MMNKNYILFLNLLTTSVRNCGIDDIDLKELDSVNWEGLFVLAVRHQVHSLIYPVVNKIQAKEHIIPEELFFRWKNCVLFNATEEMIRIEGFKNTLAELNRQKIPVVIFKGIEIKDIYPYPELRTMGDIDILVLKNHFNEADRILKKIGYIEENRDDHVIEYTHSMLKALELHNTIIDAEKDEQLSFIDDIVWSNLKASVCMEENVYVIKPTINLLYLTVHMFKHFARNGIGLRQYCDIVLYGIHYKDEIEWDYFWELVSKAGIIDFTLYLFAGSNHYFNMNIQHYNKDFDIEDMIVDEYLDLFMTELIEGGVFGGDDTVKKSEKYLLFNSSEKSFNSGSMKFLISLRILCNQIFPKPKWLSARYNYAKLHHWLLPAAWIHRLFHVITKRRKYAGTYKKSLSVLTRSKDRLDYMRAIGLLK